MADQQNNIAITVTDSVASSIETKVLGIGAAAISSDGAIKGLQQSLGALDASKLQTASAALRGAAGAAGSLATNTRTYASAAGSATTTTNAFAGALTALEVRAAAAAIAMAALATATTAYGTAARAAASTNPASNVAGVGQAATTATGGLRNMNSLLTVTRGNIGGANRLAGGFLSTLLGSSAIMEAAFAIAGPLALVGVLVEVAQAIGHVVEAYHNMQLASIQASNQAIIDGNKILKVKAGSIFSAAGIANLFTDSPLQKTIDVQNVSETLKRIEAEKQLAAAQNGVNEAGLQGEALAKQRTADSAHMSDIIRGEITQVKALQDAYRKQSEATTTTTTPQVITRNRVIAARTFTSPTITDPEQQKALQTQISATADALQNLNTELGVTNLRTEALGKKEPLAGIKDEAKAAAAAMRTVNDELARMKQGNTYVTAQQTLDLYTKHKNDLPGNSVYKQDIDSKIGGAQQQVNSQNDKVSSSVTNLLDQARDVGQYSDALKIQAMEEKQVLTLQREHITVTQGLRDIYHDLDTFIVSTAGYQAQLTTQYNIGNGPLKTYTDASAALFRLYADGELTSEQWTRQTNLVTEAYLEATTPLLGLARSLSDATQLQGKFGNALSVATQEQQVLNELRTKGITLSSTEIDQLRNTLTLAQQQAQVNSGVAALWEQQQGAAEKLTTAQLALNAARQASIGVDQTKVILSQQLYTALSAQNQLAQMQLAVDNNTANAQTRVVASLGGLLNGYKGLSQGGNAAMGQFFTTLDNGFADAIGRAVAFGQSFSSSVMDVARQAVSGLISSLVKLGIQWVITEALSLTLGASATAATTALASATALAWAPAAAFASLASFGANAVPAAAAITGTTALTLGLSAVSALANGGPVVGAGTSTSDSIPTLLSNGEYVINASSYRMHKDAVEAINAGSPAVSSVSNNVNGSDKLFGRGTTVNVIHDGSTAVQVIRGTTADEVQVIAKNAVYTHADAAMAQNLPNPNSQSRKALKQHTNVRGQG